MAKSDSHSTTMSKSTTTATTITPPFNPVSMILRRRFNERTDTDDEIQQFIDAYVQGTIPDYQMSAWLMAVCFHPLSARETATLTKCYAQSGVTLTWPDCIDIKSNTAISSPSIQPQQGKRRRPPLVDKHSSGGVGDKISLILAPLVVFASQDLFDDDDDGEGVWVPMMAGRGLGHTGGTIDKLESFQGYNPALSVSEFQRTVEEVGCAIVCATKDMCPADQRLYALRDVTGTVQSLPLQTASIMSKKIAENPDSIVLDIKYGHGAFQSTCEEAQQLAESMVAVGEANGLNPTTAFLTDMNHPIGSAVGNWVEVKECIDVLKGNLNNPKLRLSRDLITLVVVQAGQMLYQTQLHRVNEDENCNPKKDLQHTLDECIVHAFKVLDSGRVLEKFRQMLLAQGAKPNFLEEALNHPEDVPLARFVAAWTSDSTGFVHDIAAKTIGDISVIIGAGRTVVGQKVDAQAGVVFSKKVGDTVQPGDEIARVYTNLSQSAADSALLLVKEAVNIRKEPLTQERGPIITHRVTKEHGTQLFDLPKLFD